jgi:uncharacterized coiled-coil protein SlyX
MAGALEIEPKTVIVNPTSTSLPQVSVQLSNQSSGLLVWAVSTLDGFCQVSPLFGQLQVNETCSVRVVLSNCDLSFSSLPLTFAYSLVPRGISEGRVSEMMEHQSEWAHSVTCVIRRLTHEELTVAKLKKSMKKKQNRSVEFEPRPSPEEQQLERLARTIAEKQAERERLANKLQGFREELDAHNQKLDQLQAKLRPNRAFAPIAVIIALVLVIIKRMWLS